MAVAARKVERTLIVLKPDAVQRQLVGRIIQRFEDKGLRIAAMKLMTIPLELARQMYAVHEGKEFYERLVGFMTTSPVAAMVFEGVDAIAVTRKMMGSTFGPDAEPGTIRGDFGLSRRYNLIHGSDSPDAAAREISLFFQEAEMVRYELNDERWIYDKTTGAII